MKKTMFLVAVVFLFCGMGLFAQVSFGEIRFSDRVLISYYFTNIYEDINAFTIREINSTMLSTFEWTLMNDMAVEIINEMNRRNVNFAGSSG